MAGGQSAVLIACGGAAASLTAIIACYARQLGRATGLIDQPDGIRKVHETATPLVGGIAVLLPSFAVSALYLLWRAQPSFMMLAMLAAAIALLVGVLDDRFGLSPVWRLFAISYLAFSVCTIEPDFVAHTVRLNLLAPHAIAFSLDPFATPLTVLAILAFVNACNMADGMNGQLLGSVILWCAFLTRHVGMADELPLIAVICSAIVTAIFNFRGRLFSGSSGAYAASLFLALATIAAYHRGQGAIPAEMPVLWFWLPALDCIRLMAIRIWNGHSPLTGDRNHFHHMLLDWMRMRYAVALYLALLALPGIAAEFKASAGRDALLVCLVVYCAVIVLHRIVRTTDLQERQRSFHAASPSMVVPDSAEMIGEASAAEIAA